VEADETIRRFIAAFSAADFDGMRELLAPALTAYVTNVEGGVDVVEGREAYLDRVGAMDLPAARFSVELTQPPVEVGYGQVLAMVAVHAQRGDRTLENYAAHLLRVEDGGITEWRMVDAKPAESDAFWAS
jgi:ketosteroid isomerase-like protein